MTPAIDVQGATVRFGDVIALDDLSVRLDRGKIYGLLGRNGSGKTTLLSLIAAFRRADGGRILVDGAEPYENPELTERICLVRESGDFSGTETVRGALRRARRYRPGWDDELAARLLDLFELSSRRGVTKLSPGQRSALGITIGLSSRAPVTILDEAHLGLDAPSRYAFYDVLLEDYIAHPRTIVISTHLIEEVGRLFEEIVILDRGRLVAHEETEALRLRGAAVVGPAAVVDAFTEGMTVLGERRMGGTKTVTVYGSIGPERHDQARQRGLDLSPLALQDVFIHLTNGEPA